MALGASTELASESARVVRCLGNEIKHDALRRRLVLPATETKSFNLSEC